MFHDLLLSNRNYPDANYEQFSKQVGQAVEAGAQTVLATFGVSPPVANAVVQLVKGCTRLVVEQFKKTLASRAFFPFGLYYQLRPHNLGLAAVTARAMMSDLLYPPSISEVSEQHVVKHLLNAYMIDLRIGLGSPAPGRRPLLDDDCRRQFLLVTDITVSQCTRSLSEIRIKISGRNVNMIHSLQYRPLGLTSYPLATGQDDTVVLFVFSSRIVGSSAKLVFKALCYFNAEVRVVVVRVPPIDPMLQREAGALYAGKAMESVVESSLYRCLMLARAAAIGEGVSLSASHKEYIQRVLADLDGLCQLTDLGEFLQFSDPVRAYLENQAYTLPVAEGEQAVRNTCGIIVDLVNCAMSDYTVRNAINGGSKLDFTMKYRLDNVERVAGEGHTLTIEVPVTVSSDRRKIRFLSCVNVFPDGSRFLPSKLYEQLSSIAGEGQPRDVAVLMDRARVVLAFSISRVYSERTGFTEIQFSTLLQTIARRLLNLPVTVAVAYLEAFIALPAGIYYYLKSRTPSELLWQSVFTEKMAGIDFTMNYYVEDRIFGRGEERLDTAIALGRSFSSLLGLCADILGITVDQDPATPMDPFDLERAVYDKFFELFGEAYLNYDLTKARSESENIPGKKEVLLKLKNILETGFDVYVWNALRSVYRVHRLRRSLGEAFFVGVVGTGNVGKSRLIQELFGVNTSHGGSAINRTMKLTSFTCRQPTLGGVAGAGASTQVENFFALDFPGNDHVAAELTKTMFRHGLSTLNVIIIVLEGRQARLESAANVIKEVHDKEVDVPVLVCLNRADEWAASVATADQPCDVDVFKAEVANIMNEFKGACVAKGIHPEYLDNYLTVVPTCFDMRSQRQCLQDSGLVWDVKDVHNWLKGNERIPFVWRDKLTEPFYVDQQSRWKRE